MHLLLKPAVQTLAKRPNSSYAVTKGNRQSALV